MFNQGNTNQADMLRIQTGIQKDQQSLFTSVTGSLRNPAAWQANSSAQIQRKPINKTSGLNQGSTLNERPQSSMRMTFAPSGGISKQQMPSPALQASNWNSSRIAVPNLSLGSFASNKQSFQDQRGRQVQRQSTVPTMLLSNGPQASAMPSASNPQGFRSQIPISARMEQHRAHVVMQATATTAEPQEYNITKSPQDDRNYRYIKLPNDLKCVLIQDSEAEKSFAGLTVGVGSNADPVDGLAHFCEHMLFLGTKKYPQENYYNQFIQQGGGTDNAMTTEDLVTYFFDINNDKYGEALDIFSQFFKDPLFSESATERELNAIDNEHKMYQSSDQRALNQLVCSHISAKGSPIDRFTTGNLETLGKPDILQTLKDFYKQYHSSNIMNLVLVGQQSLDELQTLAESNFNSIENKNVVTPKYEGREVFNSDRSFNKIFKVIPQKNTKNLILTWSLPSKGTFGDRSKSADYISHLIGHEGPNSLLSHLIDLSLATGLSAGAMPRINETMDQFKIDFSLTEKGEKEWKRVMEIAYMYINQLKKDGPQKYIYDELKIKSQMDFENQAKQGTMSYVSIGTRMNSMKSENDVQELLTIPFAYDGFDEAEIQEKLDLLNPSNMFTIFMSKSIEEELKSNPEKFQTERWYERKFYMEDIPADFQSKLEIILPTSEQYLGNPPPNGFMPKAGDLKNMKKEDGSSIPELIQDKNGTKVFFKQDNSFDQPRVIASVKIQTTDCDFPDTAQSQVLAAIWTGMLRNYLSENFYMALIAGVSSSVAVDMDCLRLSFRSFNSQNNLKYLQYLFEEIGDFACTEEYFDILKPEMLRAYQDQMLAEPYSQGFRLFREAAIGYRQAEETIKLHENITFADFMSFREKFVQNLRFEWLIHGHITQEEALRISNQTHQLMKYTPIEQPIESDNIVELPEKTVFDLSILSESESNPNSSVLSYFQLGQKSYADMAALLVLGDCLKEPAFNTLRTQEQLGYIVACQLAQADKIIGVNFLVQSGQYGGEYLEWRVNEFLKSIKEQGGFTEEVVENIRLAQITNLKEKYKNLGEEHQAAQQMLMEEIFTFDKREKVIKELEGITAKKVNDLFFKMMIDNPKRMNIKVNSHVHQKNKEEIEKCEKENTQIYQDLNLTKKKIDDLQKFYSETTKYPNHIIQ